MVTRDNSISYEYLLRRAYQCGRYGASGADADVYRAFLRKAEIYFNDKCAIDSLTPRRWNITEEELFADYMVAAGQISSYIRMAIKHAKRMYEDQITASQFEQLEVIEISLRHPDLDILNSSITNLNVIFEEIGLFPQ